MLSINIMLLSYTKVVAWNKTLSPTQWGPPPVWALGFLQDCDHVSIFEAQLVGSLSRVAPQSVQHPAVLHTHGLLHTWCYKK